MSEPFDEYEESRDDLLGRIDSLEARLAEALECIDFLLDKHHARGPAITEGRTGIKHQPKPEFQDAYELFESVKKRYPHRSFSAQYRRLLVELPEGAAYPSERQMRRHFGELT